MRRTVVAIHAIHFADSQLAGGRRSSVGCIYRAASGPAVFDPGDRLPLLIGMRIADLHAGAQMGAMNSDSFVSAANLQHEYGLARGIALVLSVLRKDSKT